MNEKLFSEFWDGVQEKLPSGASSAFGKYFPRLKASLKALDVTSAYWSWSSSLLQAHAHLLLCGATGFGQMEIEMKSAERLDDTWSHRIDLSVLPWSEVTETTQYFSRAGRGNLESHEFMLSKADLCRRSGSPINLLPARDEDWWGGIRVLQDSIQPFTDPAVFVADVIEAQRGRVR